MKTVEAVVKLQLRRQAGTDRGPFQSCPKVPVRKFSPSQSQKSCAILARLLGRAAPVHAPGFLEFARQILLNTRNARNNRLF